MEKDNSYKTEKKQQTTPEIILEIKNLKKSFGANEVLEDINIFLKKGESLVVLGKSGTGKSMTIKCVVGLVKADEGEINIFGTDITKLNNAELNEIRVRVGFLFQNGALYDSMSVRENLRFTLKQHSPKLSKEEINVAIIEALENVGLEDAVDKMPSELSGGMRKRIGLARTLIVKPEIILYDEPTTGLDTVTAREISELIVSIQKKYSTSSIVITHDMACAKMTGDRVIILNEGVVHSEGTYEELENSSDEWVRSFFN